MSKNIKNVNDAKELTLKSVEKLIEKALSFIKLSCKNSSSACHISEYEIPSEHMEYVAYNLRLKGFDVVISEKYEGMTIKW